MARRLSLIPSLALVLWACAIDPPNWPPPHVGQQTDVTILVGRPALEIDILFAIDNSPSMAGKQTVLAENFPRMIQALQVFSGGLPNVHIGVVSSDMGAGTQPAGDNWRLLGDRGLLWGNDPSPGAIATVAGGTTDGCGLNSGARWIEDIQNPYGFGRQRNYTGELADVFACLASAVGVNGS
ncbi:MAG TPA: VWA domain-containing protein, partial [Polyangia bacterium]|nr:VWA domain-containing protein [Polyangia bacterium]